MEQDQREKKERLMQLMLRQERKSADSGRSGGTCLPATRISETGRKIKRTKLCCKMSTEKSKSKENETDILLSFFWGGFRSFEQCLLRNLVRFFGFGNQLFGEVTFQRGFLVPNTRELW